MDGKCSTERISRVIQRYDPDIVALQEIDSGKERSGLHDQAKTIAHELDMMYHFHPSFIVREGEYGNAVLSRLPMHIVKADLLPGLRGREPRAALWVEIDWRDTTVQLVVTHLSLFAKERAFQARALVGPEWLGNDRCASRAFLCGDFNSLPNTAPHRIITRYMQDTAVAAPQGKGNARTFMGVARLDYVFASRDIRVRRVQVPRTRRSNLASDHLPLVVDLEMR
jgi:endonuclease/exonuclease/phosphatase family metal-dependent hydrolase